MWIKNIILNNKFFFSNFQFFKLLLHNQKILIKNFYIIKKKIYKINENNDFFDNLILI